MGRRTTHPLTLFALKLRRARLNATLGGEPVTQTDLARLLGVSLSTVFRWETGRQLPTPDQMRVVARAFGIDDDEIWADVGHLPPDMLAFLTTTREGLQTIKNIRRIMTRLDETQQPTRRREVAPDIQFNYDYLRRASQFQEVNRKRKERG